MLSTQNDVDIVAAPLVPTWVPVMRWLPIEASSAVKAYSYNANQQILSVAWRNTKDGVYQYAGVSVDEFEAALEADSLGSAFNAIKRSHECIFWCVRPADTEFKA